MSIRRSIVKHTLGFTASIGSAAIIGTIAASAIMPQTRFVMRTAMILGAGAMGGMVGEKVHEYVARTVDEVADLMKGVQKATDAAATIIVNEANKTEAPKEEANA